MKLYNIMENKVTDIANHLMSGEQEFCTCDRCKLDVIAIALNHVPPKYLVSTKEEVYGRIGLMITQYDADIVKEIMKVSEIVKRNPRHV